MKDGWSDDGDEPAAAISPAIEAAFEGNDAQHDVFRAAIVAMDEQHARERRAHAAIFAYLWTRVAHVPPAGLLNTLDQLIADLLRAVGNRALEPHAAVDALRARERRPVPTSTPTMTG